MTNIVQIIAAIAMLEGGAPKVASEHGYLHITDRALKDYNTYTHLNVMAKELDDKGVSDDVAKTLITKVWLPGVVDVKKVGKRWSGSSDYGECLANLEAAK